MNPFWIPGQPIEIRRSGESPQAFRWEKRWHRVQDVSAHWRVHTLWWTEDEVCRDYWEVTTDSGLLSVLYRDMLSDAWHLERIYE